MRHSTLTVSAGLAMLLLAACEDEQRNAYVAPPPPPVTVAAPQVRTVTNYIELTGTTAAVNTVQLVARVEGFLQADPFPGRPAGQEGRPPVHHRAGPVPGGAAAGAVGSRCRPGQAGAGQDRVRPLFGPVQAEGGLGGRRRHLARQPRRGAGRSAGCAGQGRARPDQSRLHHGHRPVRRPHGPPHGRRRQPGGHRRLRNGAGRDQPDRPDLRLLHHQRARAAADPRAARRAQLRPARRPGAGAGHRRRPGLPGHRASSTSPPSR